MTSGERQAAIYVDGARVNTFPQFQFGQDCTGRTVIGTSPVVDDSWPGQIRGLAIYHRELTAIQILEHYETWKARGWPRFSGDDEAAGLYLFDEHAGNVVHDVSGSAMNLYIPRRYFLLHEALLKPFWQGDHPDWINGQDVLANVLGFVVFGIVFCFYWSSVQPVKHAFLATVAMGFALSLAIEILQSRLPTRNSSTADLISNTIGSALGARIYYLDFTRGWLATFRRNPREARIATNTTVTKRCEL